MSEQIIFNAEGGSFFSKSIGKLNLNFAIKECEKIKNQLKRSGKLNKEDRRLSMLIVDQNGIQVSNKYYLIKGHNFDGSIKPLKAYVLDNSSLKEEKLNMESKVIVLDLYENSTFIYSYEKLHDCYEGYIIREKSEKDGSRTIIFSRDRVKIYLKDINEATTFDDMYTFIDKMVI